MIDGSEKRKCQLAFELQSSRVFEKRSNIANSITHPYSNSAQAKKLLANAKSLPHIKQICPPSIVSTVTDKRI